MKSFEDLRSAISSKRAARIGAGILLACGAAGVFVGIDTASGSEQSSTSTSSTYLHSQGSHTTTNSGPELLVESFALLGAGGAILVGAGRKKDLDEEYAELLVLDRNGFLNPSSIHVEPSKREFQDGA